jgi:hypothetical protein
MRTVFSAKLDTARSERLERLLNGQSFGQWLREQLDSEGARETLANLQAAVKDAKDELDRLQQLAKQHRSAGAAAEVATGAAEALLAEAERERQRLGVLAHAAVQMREELALGYLLRRMTNPTEAQGVRPQEAAVVLQHLAAWLRATGFGRRASTPPPEPLRERHGFGLAGSSLTPPELLLWFATALEAAEKAGRKAATATS